MATYDGNVCPLSHCDEPDRIEGKIESASNEIFEQLIRLFYSVCLRVGQSQRRGEHPGQIGGICDHLLQHWDQFAQGSALVVDDYEL